MLMLAPELLASAATWAIVRPSDVPPLGMWAGVGIAIMLFALDAPGLARIVVCRRVALGRSI